MVEAYAHPRPGKRQSRISSRFLTGKEMIDLRVVHSPQQEERTPWVSTTNPFGLHAREPRPIRPRSLVGLAQGVGLNRNSRPENLNSPTQRCRPSNETAPGQKSLSDPISGM